MKKLFTFLFCMMLGISAFAQQKIQLRSADRAECTKSDMTSLKASFSFSAIETEAVETKGGDFAWLSMPNTVLGGNAGEPQIPVINELIVVPMGAEPTIMVTNYTASEYNLADLGIKTIVPRQLPVRKNQDPEDMPFVMSQSAYQTNGLTNEPKASVEVLGTMRGVRLGNMTIEPVSYDPVNNIIRVFNNIEVEVSFNGADAKGTEDLLVNTYSEPFNAVYGTLFNNRAVTDVYDQHPDLYNTPVKMLVICYSGFKNNSALNSWLQWKLQKGYYVDIFYTDETGTTASAIASFIKTKYNASVSAGNAYTYLIVIGDTGQVPQYMTKNIDSDIGQCASDLGYSSVNFSSSTTNYFPDMYYSRISVENTTQLTSYINKVLTYEKYEFTDGGNYLNNVLLVGGWDSNWTARVAKPTINYGKAYYFNTSNTTYGGFGSGTINAVVSTSSSQGYSGSNNGVYNGINNGACLVNYTAHGDKQEWQVPQFTAAQAATLTNTGKYFFCIGNCCLTGNFNNTTTSYSPGSTIGTTASFGETMMRVPNAGAIAYIGCSPYSYWYEDFYWAVGAHSYSQGNYPTTSASSTGVYDAMFNDANWNSASALLYLGNLAVQQAVTNGNDNSGVTDGNCNNSAHYYFQFYHTFGDGSIMPYITKPETNTVTLPSIVTPGTTSITVNALAGSYVAVTDNSSTIYGVAEANSNGVATVNFTNAIPSSGDLHVVVTRQQYQPYFGTITVQGGTQYTITANVNNSSWGTVTGAGQYYENTQCTLTATASHGYAFDHWSLNNAVASTEASYTFTVTGDAAYTAVFRQLTQHHITYEPQQTNGTIGVSPVNAYAGDIVTLTATPAAGYCLDHWDVNTVGGRKRGNITVVNNQFVMPDAEVTISATFKSGYTVSIADVANGTITATPTSALSGETITLTATPDTGCEFSTWYVYKTGDPTTLVAVVNNSFTMPSYDVTVSAVFATTTSGDVTIGSGTSAQYEVPLNNYYNYSLTQQIYTVAEVGEAGTITKVAFYVSSNAASRNIDIYMIPTTKTAFSSTTNWDVMSSVFKVYSGTYTFTTGWNVITLDTPYEYDGVKNINLGVVDNTGSCVSSSSNAMRFYVYSTSANRALRVRNDNNAYSVGTSQQISSYTGSYVTSNPQVKFTKVIKNNVSLTVSPEAINDFSYPMGMGPTEAQAVSIVGADLSNDITVTAPTDFEVSVSAAGTYSGSVTIPHTVASKGGGIRTVTDWGFEGSMQSWTAIDSDGDGYNWVLGSATSGVYLEEGSNVTDQVTGHNGSSDMMVSGSWTDATTTALTPDNWLVSPQVELGGSFSLYARPFYTAYFPEHFGIYVSTTSNSDVNTFTLLGEWTLPAEEWNQYSVDLHAYQGQSGYIAVRHFNCTDNFCILVDDFQLDTDAAYNPEFPVTVTSATVYVRMKADLGIGDYSGNMTVVSGTLNKTVALGGVVEPNGGEQYTITVNANPVEGGTVTGAGTYYEQSRVTLTATPATHYTFEGWQLNGTTVSTSASYQITVTGDAAYTAVFAPMTAHNVAITQPTGAVIVSDLSTAYAGDVVTVTYTVESGYFFVEWNVEANGQPVEVTIDGQSAQFTMPDGDVTVTATFTTGYSITLNQTEHGTISADQTTNLQPGTVVTLTATPDNGCVFMAWYAYKTGNPRDVVSVISNQYILMPSSDVTVQAIFVTEEEHEASLGSGTNTNGYIPTYVRARYSLTQQIYLASELDNQKGRITKIAYRATTRTATRNLTIYMAHTDLSSFSSTTSWEAMGSVAKVFEGSVAFSTSDWTTITLDTPFEYDGSSNINICVVDNTGSAAGSNNSYTQFYRYSGTNRALYANGSSSYASTVGYSNQLSSTTGTRISYVSQLHITMMVPGSAESLTLSPGEMSDLSYVENHGPSHTDKLDIVGIDLQNNITLNAPTNFEISLTEDGTYTSSVTVPRETGSKGNRMDVRTVTSWGFEDGLDGWTAVDADNDGYGWVLGSAVGGVYLEAGSSLTEGHTGTGLVVSGSYTNVSGDALTPDNWLISPQITQLGGSFSMWAKAQQAAYPAEHFGIYVSTTGTNPSDFTLLDEWTLTSATWKQFSVDLGLYTGQQGYIAVRHFNCTDQFMIDVDDFELDTEASITIEMPVVVTPATVYVRMKGNLNPGSYSGTLTGAAGSLNGSVSLSGVVIAEYDITVAASPAEGGTVRGAGAYADGTSVTVRAAANEGYAFVNWTEDDVEVSTDAEYTFTVTADRALVANFELATVEQEITLVQGYNWFTPAVEISLADLETALGENGVSIMTKDESVTYYAGYGWWGDDIVIVPGQMYKIQTTTACSITLSGQPAEIMDHAVTLNRGYNWIGYFGAQNMSLVSALANLQPEDGDVIMDKDLSATYYAGYGWWGDLETLVSGKGYLYKSNANVTKTFYYPSSSK